MNQLVLLAALGASIGFAVTVLLPRWWWSTPAARLERRLARHVRGQTAVRPVRGEATSPIFQQMQESAAFRPARLWQRMRPRAGGERMARLLLAAGIATALALTTTARIGAGFGWPASLGIGLGGGAILFALLVRRQSTRWRTAFLENFNDAIELIIRAIRAGIPVGEAIRQAGNEVNEPVRGEFRRIADSIDLGVDMRDALRQAGERVRLPDFDFFVVCLVLQRETGGQLSETLEGLTQILRRRKELRLKVKALTAEGRTTALIVGALPIATAALMFMIDPGYLLPLFESETGRHMLVYGAGSMIVGFLVINHLSQFRG